MKTFKEMREACWAGYKAVGLKKKGGKMVPNCVPEDVTSDDDYKAKKKALQDIQNDPKQAAIVGRDKLVQRKDKLDKDYQDFKNKKIDKDKYTKKVGDIPQQIKDINKRLGEISKEQEAITLKEKEDRRAVAETAMDREVHMELLNIIKEQGISLKEGSDSIRSYYEIAKIAYMEGLTAGLRGE